MVMMISNHSAGVMARAMAIPVIRRYKKQYGV
jgi:hypothetical protein